MLKAFQNFPREVGEHGVAGIQTHPHLGHSLPEREAPKMEGGLEVLLGGHCIIWGTPAFLPLHSQGTQADCEVVGMRPYSMLLIEQQVCAKVKAVTDLLQGRIILPMCYF